MDPDHTTFRATDPVFGVGVSHTDLEDQVSGTNQDLTNTT